MDESQIELNGIFLKDGMAMAILFFMKLTVRLSSLKVKKDFQSSDGSELNDLKSLIVRGFL
ncbi:hypothetical protein NST21_08930 [Peribacillus sp. FSL K6-1552]|uniref:hypothetical protein n=1 Tax=Peribacillus sp. FSL K6-1552 TaxID=2954514 RepID=UPI0030FB4611